MKKLLFFIMVLISVNTYSQGRPPIPPRFRTVNYIGDLSVALYDKNFRGRLFYDNCEQKTRLYFGITVKNISGNNKFSFDIALSRDGAVVPFYYDNGSIDNDGVIMISNLSIDESRTVMGYFKISNPSQSIASNPETNKTIIKAIIQEDPIAIGNVSYKIVRDLVPGNNIATLQERLIHTDLIRTGYDDLNIEDAPGNGYIIGQGNNGPGLPEYGGIGINRDNKIILTVNPPPSFIEFIKAGCLPASGKPYYYLRIGTNGSEVFLKYNLTTGVVDFTSNRSTTELAKQWIVVPAGLIDVLGRTRTAFYLYNRVRGHTYSLEYVKVEGEYVLSMRNHDNNSRYQKFSME